MVLRWRGAKNIGIYGVFLFREREKLRKHRLLDAFWGFAKTVDLTILGGLQKVPTITTTTTTGPSSNSYNNNNHDDDDNDNSKMQLAACHVRKFRWNPPLSFPPPTPTGIACVRSSTIYIHHTYVDLSRKRYTPNGHVSGGNEISNGWVWSVPNIYRQTRYGSKPFDTLHTYSCSHIPKILTPKSPTLICSNFSRKLFVKSFCCLRFGWTTVTLTFANEPRKDMDFKAMNYRGSKFPVCWFPSRKTCCKLQSSKFVVWPLSALKQDQVPDGQCAWAFVSELFATNSVGHVLITVRQTHKKMSKAHGVHIYVLIFWRINLRLCRQKTCWLVNIQFFGRLTPNFCHFETCSCTNQVPSFLVVLSWAKLGRRKKGRSPKTQSPCSVQQPEGVQVFCVFGVIFYVCAVGMYACTVYYAYVYIIYIHIFIFTFIFTRIRVNIHVCLLFPFQGACVCVCLFPFL